jgi:hypothetical protein
MLEDTTSDPISLCTPSRGFDRKAALLIFSFVALFVRWIFLWRFYLKSQYDRRRLEGMTTYLLIYALPFNGVLGILRSWGSLVIGLDLEVLFLFGVY